MLHITNGDSAIQVLNRSGLASSEVEFLAWQDVLHEGPVLPGMPLQALSDKRAAYIAEQGWGDPAAVQQAFLHRDKVIAGDERHSETVLWFEADLYDQLQLMQILDYFSSQGLAKAKLSLVSSEAYISSLSPEQVREFFQERSPVSDRQLAIAASFWSAFRSPEPQALQNLLQTDLSALPFLRNALLRFLEEYPSRQNGLSRSEHQALDVISTGENKLRQVYLESHHAREPLIFLGDIVFARYIQNLSRGKEPLILRQDGAPIQAPRWNEDQTPFWESRVLLTPLGEDVLKGKADQIEHNGIDRWLGGVHLQGKGPLWRWASASRHLVKM